ncbi:PilN family type IVB pilus formation outer membrane protein [Pseudomonas sp. JG-B]|uniref:PilN family type IVB pilus formation outer membrane protein n=1 Tax=Pseudomonas sp. JG-B TaxID=2603214 RepID=UPI0035580259
MVQNDNVVLDHRRYFRDGKLYAEFGWAHEHFALYRNHQRYDRPYVLEQVGEYLEEENENLSRQVMFNVQVYNVTLNDEDNVGIDWNLVYKAANGNLSFALENTAPGINSSAIAGTIGITDGDWAGSTAIVKALSQQGKVSVVTNPTVTTLNLNPVPLQIARQTTYIQSAQVTNTPDVGTTGSLNPGTVTAGFNMMLLPRIMDDKELILWYTININTLIRLGSEEAGGTRIQTPEIDGRLFDQKVKLKSGQTWVLSGFDQTSEQGTQTGTGAAWNFLLGGSAVRKTTRDIIVVMITPYVVKG